MKTLTTILTVLGLTAAHWGYAQESKGKLTGALSGNDKPVEAAAVNLLNAKDSSLVKTALSGADGTYTITSIPSGKYLVRVEALGFRKYYSGGFEINDKKPVYQLPSIHLASNSQELNGVVVTSKRPFIEQKLDKTVVNVDASPTNTGLTAMDVLEKSPGITVDKDGNISLKGKAGVLILVDGKPTYLSATDLANMLKNLSSSNLDQIEIMTNPPAKYDAAGNAGVINIRTKKIKIKGLNGSVTLGGGMGKRPKTNNSFNLNYRAGKVNLFGNYSHNWNKNVRDLNLVRNFRDQQTDAVLTTFRQRTDMDNNYQTHNFKVGMDYFATKKTTFGVVLTGFFNPGRFKSHNVTNILQPNGQLDSVTVADNNQKDKFNNIGANFNFRHVFDTTSNSPELTADLDYVQYNSGSSQMLNNLFYDNAGQKVRKDELIRGELPSNIHIYSGKVDYTLPLKGDAKFEAGAKSSYVKTDNDAQYSSPDGSGGWNIDKIRSNHFIYTENINAAYVNLSKQFSKKWSGQLGLRMENTNAKGNQTTTGQSFDRHYTQLFPTAFVGFNPNDKNQLGLSYGRRIERPDYQDMNPFYFFLDKYTYQVGNPYLRPQFSHNIELTHTFHGFLTSSIGYSRTDDIIMDVLEQVDSIKTTYQTKKNIAKTRSFTASVSANLPLTKWWKINIYAQANNSKFAGVINNGYLEAKGTSFMTNISNQFELKNGWNLELSGFYRGRAVEGTLVARPMGMMSFAVSKQVMKKKGTIRLNIRDFLDLQYFSGYSRYQNVDIDIRNHWDNRVVNISFTYRFSKGQAVSQQRKRGGAGEEQNRVKVGGN